MRTSQAFFIALNIYLACHSASAVINYGKPQEPERPEKAPSAAAARETAEKDAPPPPATRADSSAESAGRRVVVAAPPHPPARRKYSPGAGYNSIFGLTPPIGKYPWKGKFGPPKLKPVADGFSAFAVPAVTAGASFASPWLTYQRPPTALHTTLDLNPIRLGGSVGAGLPSSSSQLQFTYGVPTAPQILVATPLDISPPPPHYGGRPVGRPPVHPRPPRPGAGAPPTPPDIKYDGWQPIAGPGPAPHGPAPASAPSAGGGPSDSYGAPLSTVTGAGGVVASSGEEVHALSGGGAAAGGPAIEGLVPPALSYGRPAPPPPPTSYGVPLGAVDGSYGVRALSVGLDLSHPPLSVDLTGAPCDLAYGSSETDASSAPAPPADDGDGKSYGRAVAAAFGSGGELVEAQSVDLEGRPARAGTYAAVQVQPASAGGADHVLDEGLLQSIFAAIEGPRKDGAGAGPAHFVDDNGIALYFSNKAPGEGEADDRLEAGRKE